MLSIKVLGPGCINCGRVYAAARGAAAALGVQARIEKVTDPAEFTRYGLLLTPGLVINETLVCGGRVPAEAEVRTWIAEALAGQEGTPAGQPRAPAEALLAGARAVLKHARSFAVVGVSREPEKYGHEVFAALRSRGYQVYPVNPKYTEIEGCPCYPSLAALPARPDVVVLALAPPVAERVVPEVVACAAPTIWMPPGCFTPTAVETSQAAGMQVLHDICPVFALRTLAAESG